MLTISTPSLKSGLRYDRDMLKAIAALGPVAWLEGGLNADGKYVDRLNGRLFSPINLPPVSIAAPGSGRRALRFNGGGALRADDNADLFTSLTAYSIIAVTRIAASAQGGIFASNDIADTSGNPMIAYIDVATFRLSGFGSFASGSHGAASNAQNDAAWHTNITSCFTSGGTSRNSLQTDSVAAAVGGNNSTMSSASGGQKLLVGGNTNSALLPFKGDLAALLVFPFGIAEASNSAALALVKSYTATIVTDMNT